MQTFGQFYPSDTEFTHRDLAMQAHLLLSIKSSPKPVMIYFKLNH